METDDQFKMTALDLLLTDRGVDLHDYSMNLRQMALSFHSQGLAAAMTYLGLDPF